MRKYTCNENFFLSDTPESFYWAGFIAADGCLSLKRGKSKMLSIGLAEKDENHINKFITSVGFTGKINHSVCREKFKVSSVKIYSSILFDSLGRFNLGTNKSLILSFPDKMINNKLINHFMRGYFDGDGSISCGSDGQLKFGLRGTIDFLKTYNDILKQECSLISVREPEQYDSIGELQYHGNRIVPKIMDFLYHGSNNNTKLDRKYDEFITNKR